MRGAVFGLVCAVVSGCTCDETERVAARAQPSVGETATQAAALPPPPANLPAPPDVAKAPADAVKTVSGLATKVLRAGTGTEHPRVQDEVTLGYVGWTKSGEMFQRSPEGQPLPLRVKALFPGFLEGTQLMVTGEKRRVWVPSALGFGERPQYGMPAGDLVMDIELFEIVKLGDQPETPDDVAGPPPTATRTQSGLAYRVLKPGTGRTPAKTDTVYVIYSGWTSDGHLFDSSVPRGRPMAVQVNGVIGGWTEGLQLMKEGEKARLWIPGELAYGATSTSPGKPAGILVFDIEMVRIKDPKEG
jgi:peptidylprolyl isomerase